MSSLTAACLYTYLAIVTGVYDGDTITADVDLGMHTWQRGVKVRLARIDAPEVRGDEREQGFAARDWVRERILGKEIVIQTIKDKKGKYGRYLGEIWLNDENLNDAIVSAGHADYRDY